MKLPWAATLLFLGSQGVASLSIPATSQTDLIKRDLDSTTVDSQFVDLEKRRGGGGGGGRGGGGGGSSGGSSGGRSGSSSSSSGSSSSGGSSSSSRGGYSSGGSGVAPAYGGGRYYAGGARAPYAAGSRSSSGITPYLLPLGALAIFPGIWLAGAYAYPYAHPYYYHDDNTNKNESLPVTCLCEQYSECGCDDNNNSTYYESLFNGTQPRNTSQVQVANVNGTKTIVINGTLPNGTTADDGTTSSTSSTSSTSGAAPGPWVTLVNASGYWVTVAVVIATVWSF